MANITAETTIILNQPRGEDVRDAFVDALLKIAGEGLPDVDASDEDKILAVNTSGKWAALSVERKLSSIAVTTNPTKMSYTQGESLDLTGIVVTATLTADLTSETTEVVTGSCTFSPANGSVLSSIGSQTVTVSYTDDGVTKTTNFSVTVAHAASGISVTSLPTKTNYTEGDTLDLSGIGVTLTYSDGTTEDVTSSCTFSPANGSTLSTSGTKTVTVSYDGMTTTFNVYVGEVPSLDRIVIRTNPNKTTYSIGETLDYTGLVIGAIYDNHTEQQIPWTASGVVVSPAQGTTLNQAGTIALNVSYTQDGVTESTTMYIQVTAVMKYLTITSPPTKTSYTSGEGFTSAGLAVSFTSTTTVDVTSSITLNFTEGETLICPDGQSSITYPVEVSYVDDGHTYTASFNIVVHA